MVTILMGTFLWIPIAVSGLPKTSLFSMHWINMIDIGILSGIPYTQYGWKNQLWNETNVLDGYEVESYNFTNIPEVVGVQFDFQALLAKVENGRTSYQRLSSPYRDAFPFDGLSFQYLGFALKSFLGRWESSIVPLDVSESTKNDSSSMSDWRETVWTSRSQIFVDVRAIIDMIPATHQVPVTFETNWTLTLIMSSRDANLSDYRISFERSASVDLLMQNSTALSASGRYTVETGDTETVPITYRSLPLDLASYVAYGLFSISLVAVVAAFRRRITGALRRMVGRPIHPGTTGGP